MRRRCRAGMATGGGAGWIRSPRIPRSPSPPPRAGANCSRSTAPARDAWRGPSPGWRSASEVSSPLLLALDRLEECLEVPLAEAARAVALDDLEEDRRPVADRLREDLQQVALVVAVDQDAEPAEVRQVLLDLADPLRHVVVVLLGDLEELDALLGEGRDAADDVARGDRDVLRPGAAVVLDVLLDLRLALALGGLVDRELHAAGAVGHDLGHQRRVLGRDRLVGEVDHLGHAEDAL